MDGSGDAIAAWGYFTGTEYRVQARWRPVGGAWSDAREWTGWSPSVAIDADGDVIVAWVRDTGGGSVAESATRVRGRGWSAPEQMSTPADGWINLDSVRVGMDAPGNASATWVSSLQGIRSAFRPLGSAWRQPVAITDRYGWEPNLQVASTGKALVVWSGFDELDRYSRFAALGQGGTWESPRLVATTRTGANLYPEPASAAIQDDGRAVIAWADAEHGNEIVSAAYHATAASGWEVTADVSFPDGNADAPVVGIDGSGNAHAVWDARVDVEGAIRPADGGGWLRPVVVGGTQGAPRLDVDASGRAVAAWLSVSGRLEASTRAAGSATWDRAPAAGYPSSPVRGVGDLAVDDAGNALVAWSDVGGSGAWAGALDASAPALSQLRVPRHGVRGRGLGFSVRAVDAWSTLAGPPLWRFGDGTRARGGHVTHTYAHAGTYTVSVEATDAVGHSSRKAARVRVARRARAG